MSFDCGQSERITLLLHIEGLCENSELSGAQNVKTSTTMIQSNACVFVLHIRANDRLSCD